MKFYFTGVMEVKINRRQTRSCPIKVKLQYNNHISKDYEASNCQPEVLRAVSGVAKLDEAHFMRKNPVLHQVKRAVATLITT